MSKRQKKILFLGGERSGKSSIINRFATDTFNDSNNHPSGIHFVGKRLDGQDTETQIWESSGQAQYQSMAIGFFTMSSTTVLVYDVTDESSFEEVRRIHRAIKSNYDLNSKIFIIGNKTDLAEQRKVSFAQGFKLSSEVGAMFYEVSAKTGDNIKSLFKCISQELQSN